MKRKLQIISATLILLSSICFATIYLHFDNKLKIKNDEIESKRIIEEAFKHNFIESRTYYFATKNTEEHIKVLKALNANEYLSKLEKDVDDNFKTILEAAFSSANLTNEKFLTEEEVRQKTKIINNTNRSRKEIDEATAHYMYKAKEGFNNLEKEIVEIKKNISSLESKKNLLYIFSFFIQAAGMFLVILSENYSKNK